MPSPNPTDQDILLSVRKPSRYIGSEFNSVYKVISKDTLNFALCFPDSYEVGMSHLGIKIIYHLLNKRKDVYCQRCFCPWPDMERVMRQNNIPLFSLEMKQPLKSFDIIGFSLTYELAYTNVLNMLELSGIPFFSSQRKGFPLIIAGGHCCSNPEPMAEFIDVFIIGEAEEVILEFVSAVGKFKAQKFFKNTDEAKLKDELLLELAQIEGVYVPRFYQSCNEGATNCRVAPIMPRAPESVRRRFVRNLDDVDFPVRLPVAITEIVHERINLEIMRGCPHGCYFCQAAFTVTPVRMRKVDNLLKLAKASYYNSGYDQIGFCALSSASYPHLKELIAALYPFCKEKGLKISFPSLRIEKNFDAQILKTVHDLKKSTLTFAPETGSKRLRTFINKDIDLESLKELVTEAYRLGWQRVKLYFMIGLPTETEEDLAGIADLADEFSELKKTVDGRRGKVNIAVSNFIPRPHTPLQWFGMEEVDILEKKQQFLKERLKAKNIEADFQNPKMSFLEAYLVRSDRRSHKAILAAFKAGARFDAWTDMFNFGIWKDAFLGREPEIFGAVHKLRKKEDSLAWEHINCGYSKDALYAKLKDNVLIC